MKPSPVPRPSFFPDPASDRIVAIVAALGAEVGAILGRLDTIETLAARKGVFSRDEIEAYVPDDADHARRFAMQQAFVDRVFNILKQDMEENGAAR